MKNIFRNIAILLVVLISVSACEDDFLEREPLDDLSVDNFFNSSTDLEVFVNGLYNNAMPRWNTQQSISGISDGFADVGSDFMINGVTPTGSLSQQSATGVAPINSGFWNGRYDNIRRANIFITNYDRVSIRDQAADQYIGEGYFFRAFYYFSLLNAFGGIPIIDQVLDVNDEALYTPRSPRDDVARFIIQDLDSAIEHLSWKGNGPAVAGRINKESALVMKARVALFEGTWEHYHAKNGTPHAVPGSDGTAFLQMVEPAIQQVIAVHGNNVFGDYNQLFSQVDGAATPGVFWYRVYDTNVLTELSHNFYWKVVDTGAAFTDRLVNMYLDVDGIPQRISTRPLTTLNEKGQNLDPRFRATVWTPDRGPMDQIEGRGALGDLALRYPLLIPAVEFITATGYRQWKGAIFGTNRLRAGEADDILIRYAEGLLAMAEAKAILGTISQVDLDATVNVLRDRVGAVPMNLGTVNNWSINYAASEGFDPSAANVVNEIRRERSVELANEGFRLNDLRRWGIFEDAINGYIPKGANLQEFMDYFNEPSRVTADGYTGNLSDLQLVEGVNVQSDPNGAINPFFRNPDFEEGGQGFFVNPRDYLSPIPTGQIDLYRVNGVELTQNPGWNL